ncbi:conserved Plasmodium protein, unknown function [Plasmodium gaboni]|uniref:Uncharacterized protein n=1 Tax=Plasmodium gaboni TaxID=647221 RepID=A0ABY0KVW9_9APIC|nr:conserved Plasmodium protein, unknown function [Plasmodium gaboni]
MNKLNKIVFILLLSLLHYMEEKNKKFELKKKKRKTLGTYFISLKMNDILINKTEDDQNNNNNNNIYQLNYNKEYEYYVDNFEELLHNLLLEKIYINYCYIRL